MIVSVIAWGYMTIVVIVTWICTVIILHLPVRVIMILMIIINLINVDVVNEIKKSIQKSGSLGGGLGGKTSENGGQPSEPKSFDTGAFGGGGGGSSGSRGSDGGAGLYFGGGGGGAGAKSIGSFVDTGTPGQGAWGAGNGGVAGASSGSAGGGGGAYGGAIAILKGSLEIIDCTIQNNMAKAGSGGKHPWGWPAGHVGQSFGGGVFAWNMTDKISIDNLNTSKIAFNRSSIESNLYDSDRVAQVHLAPYCLTKKPLLEVFGSLTLSRNNQELGEGQGRFSLEECTNENPADDVKNAKRIVLPVSLVEDILEQYVGWDLSQNEY